MSPRPSTSWTATRSGRHGSSRNCPVRTTPRWRRRGTMREPAGAPAGTERREEGTRASAPARGVSRSAAVYTVPPKQNKHDLGLPTHNVFATVRVLDDRLLFGIRAIRSVVTISEALGQLCSACRGRTLSSLLIQTSTHRSLNQQHRLADDQPAAARHELSEHRLLSSRRGGAQLTRVRISDKPKNPNVHKSTTDRKSSRLSPS